MCLISWHGKTSNFCSTSTFMTKISSMKMSRSLLARMKIEALSAYFFDSFVFNHSPFLFSFQFGIISLEVGKSKTNCFLSNSAIPEITYVLLLRVLWIWYYISNYSSILRSLHFIPIEINSWFENFFCQQGTSKYDTAWGAMPSLGFTIHECEYFHANFDY